MEFDIQNRMPSMYSGVILPIIYETIRDQEWPYKSKKNLVRLMIMWKGQPFNTKAKRAKYNLQRDILNLKYCIFKGFKSCN